jgi:phage terminase small subunit
VRGASNGIYERYAMNQLSKTRTLTDKQTALVDTLVAKGCTIVKAAELAGYAVGESGRVTACKALKLAHVQQYMMQRMNEEFGLSATLAAGTVRRLALGAKSEYVQLEASKDLLDRAGYKPIDRSQVQVAGDIRVSIDLG